MKFYDIRILHLKNEEFTAEDAKNAKQSNIFFATFAFFAVIAN